MKICCTCKTRLPIARYHRKAGHGDGYQAVCKDCAVVAAARSRRKNRSTKKALVIEAKLQPCVDCQRCYPARIMHFDHVRGEKVGGIAALAHSSMPVIRFKDELAKCDLRCANCHGLRHEEDGWSHTTSKASTLAI